MSRIETLNARYAASAELVEHGVELLIVGDPAGARLNAAIRQLLLVVHDDGSALWDDLVGAVKALRWRLVTQPQPLSCNFALQEGVENVHRELGRLVGGVGESSRRLISELAEAADGVRWADPIVGPVLLRSIKEVGASECIVVAASSAAAVGLQTWLREYGVAVRTVGQLERTEQNWEQEQAYAIGPPTIFQSSLVTAPVSSAVSFLFPAWYGDRSIPRSAIARYADGAVAIQGRIFEEGDLAEPTTPAMDVEDELSPEPIWGTRIGPSREPSSDEVVAHRVLLSGNLAILLDDGERIRSLEPEQPAGERVTFTQVSAVRPGTYLLLREGQNERRALYEAALNLMGKHRREAEESQLRWKDGLQAQIDQVGIASVVRQLQLLGVHRLERVRAWIDPTLTRPQSDQDFERLLNWLEIPIHPAIDYATTLRRHRARAGADAREQLEKAVAAADLSALERDGHRRMDLEIPGFKGIIATRVLAISPTAEIVPRHDVRVPFTDRGAQWLE